MGRHLRASSFKSLRNVIKHTKTVPYHSASNGAAENAARTFKKKFGVLLKDNTRQDALCKYLFYYRSTSHCEKTPAELHLNRCLGTRQDVIKPDIRSRVEQKQSNQQRFLNRAVTFGVNDSVMAKDYKTKWRQAAIVEQTSLVTYNVRTDDVSGDVTLINCGHVICVYPNLDL